MPNSLHKIMDSGLSKDICLLNGRFNNKVYSVIFFLKCNGLPLMVTGHLKEMEGSNKPGWSWGLFFSEVQYIAASGRDGVCHYIIKIAVGYFPGMVEQL